MADALKTRQTGSRELVGIILLTFSLLMALALVSYQWQDIPALKLPANSPPANYIGPAGAWFGFVALAAFGIAAVGLPVGGGVIGMLILFKPKQGVRLRILLWMMGILALSGLLQLYPARFAGVCEKFNISGLSGGILGWLLAERALGSVLGTTGAAILLAGILAGCMFVFVGRRFFRALFRAVAALWLRIRARIEEAMEARRDRFVKIAREEKEIAKQRALIEKQVKREQRLARLYEVDAKSAATAGAGRKTVAPVGRQPGASEQEPAEPVFSPEPAAVIMQKAGITKKSMKKQVPESKGARQSYVLPAIDLLQPLPPARERKMQGDVQTTARILKETLAEFGIESDVTNIEQGPVVTRYELLPAPGVRVEKISQLSNNITLTLKAADVRVQAPIPGKGVVGIEVPNAIASRVYLREILEGETWREDKCEIPLILGKDVAGNDLVADLASMPHLLIAGSTGSGKTVCINSILTGFLMSRSPADLRMMLVDPKIVEFAVYNHLPHLVAPVITDPKKVPLGLRWAINEMEKRYKLFARAGVRTIQGYNNRKPSSESAPVNGESEPMPDHIPYVVIVIDELADLMSTAQADIENQIARLAQLSRAVGIHMILATQRPSVNVITGTIKANFPARISFQVAQKVDSRTILDTGGADKLLGRGDMLILPPGTSKLVRAQGALTTDEDVNQIVAFIKERSEPNYEIAVKQAVESSSAAGDLELEGGDGDDELLNTAIEIIRESRRASVSMLQRRMKIGYNRAGRLMDVLENMGIVGPAHGSDPREILIDLDNEIPQNVNNSEREGA